jgi:GntR family transcriptional regulator / MocR family aminotransferase
MLRSWTLPLKLEHSADVPIYIQVARAISREIRRGRLTPGSPLPGTRALSQLLKVHRNTITAAYEELTMEGWTVSDARNFCFQHIASADQRLGDQIRDNKNSAGI